MVDLLVSIETIVKSCSNIRGDSANELVQNNIECSYNELLSMVNGISKDSRVNPNIDLRKLWVACYINAILILPLSGNSQGPSFTPELASQALENLIDLQIAHPKANDRLISRISDAIINSELVEEYIEWAKQAKVIYEALGTDISYVKSLIAIKIKRFFYKNCSNENKDKNLKHLQNLLELKNLEITIEKSQKIVVRYALEWMEEIIDLRMFKGKSADSCSEKIKEMMDIINQLEIREESLLKRIRKINEYFSEVSKHIPVNGDIEYKNQRRGIIMGLPISVHKDISVYQCKIIWNRQEIDAAIKTYKDANPNKYIEQFEKEVKILKRISGRSACFLDYYESFVDEIFENKIRKYCYSIVMEYCPRSLSDEISRRKRESLRFSPEELSKFCIDLLEAFECLLKLKIYHQDIKPDNILISKDGQLKIADFNISEISESSIKSENPGGMHNVLGTVRYMAPELRNAWINGKVQENYRPELSDVFSLGLMFYECATWKDISRFNENSENRKKILEDVRLPWLKNIIYDMLNFDFKVRPSFRSVLSRIEGISTKPKNSHIEITEENKKELSEILPGYKKHANKVSSIPEFKTNRSQYVNKPPLNKDRRQKNVGAPIFVRNELNANQWNMWEEKEIDAIIKTYKYRNGYKSIENFKKEVEKSWKLGLISNPSTIIMDDLLLAIGNISKSYGGVQGDSAKELIRKNSSCSFIELCSLYQGFAQDAASNQNIDLWQLFQACYTYAIIQLPVFTENPQETKLTPELTGHAFNGLIYLANKCGIPCPKANEKAISKIIEGIKVAETFDEVIEWAKQAKAFKDTLQAEISLVNTLVSIKAKFEFYKTCSSNSNDEILKNLKYLLNLKNLEISVLDVQNIEIDYALAWIEDVNDIRKFNKFQNEQVVTNPDTIPEMLKIINQLVITEENTNEKLKKLNELFPIIYEPVVEVPDQLAYITNRTQILMGPPIFVRNELNVSQCRIMWNGKEIDAVIKTYKEVDGYKSVEKFKKEVEILQRLSGYGRFFLNFYGYFYDEIIESDIKKYCSSVIMEYCPYSLAGLMKQKSDRKQPFSPQELISLVLDLLEAFRILVGYKIYHQDIKPDNILIAKDGQLKIADFNVSGIRETIESTYMPTGVNDIIGTPSYMAPELRSAQINGVQKAKYRPERADVFSLGLVFYQCATFDNLLRFNEDPSNREKILKNVMLPWLRELLYDMLCFDYKDRLSFSRALKKVIHNTTIS